KPCPPESPATNATLAASANASSGNSVTTPSFTLEANKTYLVFASTTSSSGDSATPSSTFQGNVVFHSLGSQFFKNKNYNFAWWGNGGAADSTGTIKVSFLKNTNRAFLQVVELNGNSTSNPIAQSAFANGNNTTPYTATLPAPPGSGNSKVVFLTANEDLGGSAPVATPSMTNLVYLHGGSGSAGTYASNTASQNTSFAGGNKHWGT